MVEQTRNVDDAPACGSVDPDAPERGCYGGLGRPFTCAPAGDADRTHDAEPVDEDGDCFANACAPGYLPLLRRSANDLTRICVATCSPMETYSDDGTVVGHPGGDPEGWTCAERGVIGSADSPVECRFFTRFEDQPSTGRNGIGLCLQPRSYLYDSDGDTIVDSPWPLCTELSTLDENSDGTPDHAEWGCAPFELPAGKTAQVESFLDLRLELALPVDEDCERLQGLP